MLSRDFHMYGESPFFGQAYSDLSLRGRKLSYGFALGTEMVLRVRGLH